MHAQDFSNFQRNQTVEVYGTASIKIKPDIMKWEISVEVDDNNAANGKKLNDKSTVDVINLIKSKGISEKEIQTQGVRINKNYVYQYSETKKYSVINYIWFLTSDMNLYDNLTDELMKIENVFIKSVNLEYSKSAELRSKARLDAISAAKKKAEEMAGALGLTLGKPVQIDEVPLGYYYPYTQNNVSNIQDYSTSDFSLYFSQGMISVEAKVKIIFELK
jgi:uncharacterized protein YggE